MICGYCAADTEQGEPHTIECQVYRILNDNPEDYPHIRAIQLAQIVILMNAVQQLGWQTHTSDWDWSLEVTLRDGAEYGIHDEKDVYGDNFYLRSGEETIDLNNSWTACTSDGPKTLTHFVIEFTEDDKVNSLAIPVETLHTIRVYSE